MCYTEEEPAGQSTDRNRPSCGRRSFQPFTRSTWSAHGSLATLQKARPLAAAAAPSTSSTRTTRTRTPEALRRAAAAEAARGPYQPWCRPRLRLEGGGGARRTAPSGFQMSKYAWKELLIDGKVKFKVPAHLELIKKVGSGAYGTVCSFMDPKKGEKLAVKKITDAFHDLVDGKRILREVKLLRCFKHDNIICILDMYPPDHPDFDDIYIVTDLMETDLHKVIYSKQVLNDEHHQYFSYQILRGLLYLHSANVVHRDLKPSNILVNKNCDLKICDFGLARGFGNEEDLDTALTDYVVTRWYRAPEVVLLASEYTKSIDVWSVGCILCELIARKPAFTGKDHLDQIKKIFQVIGTPSEADLEWLPTRGAARNFIKKATVCPKQPWKTVIPQVTPNGVDAIERMLTFNPLKRANVAETLELPYYETLHMPDDEPIAEKPIDWNFDKFTPTKRLLQNKIYAECYKFHNDIAVRDKELLGPRGIDKKTLEG